MTIVVFVVVAFVVVVEGFDADSVAVYLDVYLLFVLCTVVVVVVSVVAVVTAP